MTRLTAVTGCILMSAMVIPGAATGQSGLRIDHARAPRVHLADPVARGTVTRAVLGAAARLDRPGCQQILTDYRDGAGQLLLVSVDASSRSAAEYLIERVWFVDGDETRHCRLRPETAAFTAAGDHVIRVCASRFAGRFARQAAAAEVLVIHELLHTLGLGENPPTSAEITRQVTARCGGS